ncbi:tellurite resistance TerB family protein [Endozoicomonas sp. Mp262]
MGKGAIGGSAITMLLSSKKGRRIGGKVLAVGGTIGLGAIAYNLNP